MVGGWVFLLVPAHTGSPGQTAIKRLLLLLQISMIFLASWVFKVLKKLRDRNDKIRWSSRVFGTGNQKLHNKTLRHCTAQRTVHKTEVKSCLLLPPGDDDFELRGEMQLPEAVRLRDISIHWESTHVESLTPDSACERPCNTVSHRCLDNRHLTNTNAITIFVSTSGWNLSAHLAQIRSYRDFKVGNFYTNQVISRL